MSRATSSTGWIVPTSLLAQSIVTRATDAASRASSASSTSRRTPADLVERQLHDDGALVRGEPLDGVDRGVVLAGGDEDAGPGTPPRRRARSPAGCHQSPLDREVHRLGAAAGEDDLDAVGAEGRGDALARLLEEPLGLLARAVDRRRVAHHGERGGERLDRLGAHRGGRGVVEVDHGVPSSRPMSRPAHAGVACAVGALALRTTVDRMSAPDPLHDLGVRTGADGGSIRIWSEHATSIELEVFDDGDLDWAVERTPLVRDGHGVWAGILGGARARRALRLAGRRPGRLRPRVQSGAHPARPVRARTRARAPTARGAASRSRRSPTTGIRLGAARRSPASPLDHTVVYEAHVRGFSKLNRAIPEPLRGTYAGLAHDASLEYLTGLGVTTVELLPVHAFVTEQRLVRQGRLNYWGYNTLAFFAAHAPYASAAAQAEGAARRAARVRRHGAAPARGRPRGGARRRLQPHRRGGPAGARRTRSAASTTRRTTATTRTAGTSTRPDAATPSTSAAARRSGSCSTRCGTSPRSCRSTGSASTSRPRSAATTTAATPPSIRCCGRCSRIRCSRRRKLIAEPWDVGPGGWQTGNFPAGFAEWNDRYRDRMRDFWLGDLRRERETGTAGSGIGRFATRLAGLGEHLLASSAARSRASTS